MQTPARLTIVIGIAVLATATACGADNNHDAPSSRKAATDTPAIPAFVEMDKADILRSAMGCLHPPPYPLDGGPICLRDDGSWIRYSGWGQGSGRFRIVGNRVFMHGPPDAVVPSEPDSVAFFRDRNGAMFISDEPLNTKRPLRPFKPKVSGRIAGARVFMVRTIRVLGTDTRPARALLYAADRPPSGRARPEAR